jgi:hypothetical protein
LKNLIENFEFHLNNKNIVNNASESWDSFFDSQIFLDVCVIYRQDQVVRRENETTAIFCLTVGMGVKTSVYILASKETTDYVVLFCYDRENRSPFTMYVESKKPHSLYVTNELVGIDIQTATYDQAMCCIQSKKIWQLFAWLDEDMKLHYCNTYHW